MTVSPSAAEIEAPGVTRLRKELADPERAAALLRGLGWTVTAPLKAGKRVRLTDIQRAAMQATKDSAATGCYYWPNGRHRLSLIALERRGLVVFHIGRGWSLTASGWRHDPPPDGHHTGLQL